jgi:hypothetical protein
MKVLTSKSGSVLIFSTQTHGKFLALDATEHDKGVVAEVADREVARQTGAALRGAQLAIAQAEAKAKPDAIGVPFGTGGPFAYLEQRDVKRDLTYIAKNVADVADGTEVGVLTRGRGMSLDIPQGALPNYSEGLKVGSRVAVGPSITPKALINARGRVVTIKGARAGVEFDAADIDRVKRATGKPFANPVAMPTSCLEVIADEPNLDALREALGAADAADEDAAVAFLTIREAVEGVLA